MRNFDVLGKRKCVLGMVHLQPLPGTPFHVPGSLPAILAQAVESARSLEQGGADGCLVQTVDRVYPRGEERDPARIAALALIVNAVAAATGEDFQVGVQMMSNALTASLAIAKVAGGSFIRATALVGATLGPSGVIQADPLEVMAYRREIDATSLRVIAEVDTMHFSWLGGAKPTADVAAAAARAGADAVAVSHPDETTARAMVAAIKQTLPGMAVILAGGTTHANAARMLSEADGAFVGSCLEREGWGGQIDVDLVAAYVERVRDLD
jgi:membrane complex biogenesis BtpA family protein